MISNFAGAEKPTKTLVNEFRLATAGWGRGGGGYSHILAIRVCAAGKGMVFKPFVLG